MTQLTPLWTDENIANDARRASSNPTTQATIRSCLLFMRHGYEHDRDQLAARVAALEARLVEVEGWAHAATEVIAQGVELMPVDQLGKWESVGFMQTTYGAWDEGVTHWGKESEAGSDD